MATARATTPMLSRRMVMQVSLAALGAQFGGAARAGMTSQEVDSRRLRKHWEYARQYEHSLAISHLYEGRNFFTDPPPYPTAPAGYTLWTPWAGEIPTFGKDEVARLLKQDPDFYKKHGSTEYRLYAALIEGFKCSDFFAFANQQGFGCYYRFGGRARNCARARSLGLAGKHIYAHEIDFHWTNAEAQVIRVNWWLDPAEFDPLLQLVAGLDAYSWDPAEYGRRLLWNAGADPVDPNVAATEIADAKKRWVVDGALVDKPSRPLSA